MSAEMCAIRRRIDEREGEVGGEKMITRHMLDQLRQNTDVLLELSRKVERLGDAVAIIGAQLTTLEPKLCGIVADSMREAIRQRQRD